MLAATVEVESGPRGPWAIRNETTKESRWFRTREEAERLALAWHDRGDVLGLGPAQITRAENHRRFGLTDASGRPVRAFDLCLNLRAALAHADEDEERAARERRAALARQFNGGPRALRAGAVPAADVYAARVEATYQRVVVPAAPPPEPATPECVQQRPPEWDAWASARHAARCGQPAARRIATDNRKVM